MTCIRSMVGLAVAFGFAASLAAQTPQPQTPQSPPDRPQATAPSATSDKEITVAGCVRPGTEANSFMLNVADNPPTGARPTDPGAPATRPPSDPSAPRPPSDPTTRPSDPPTARPSTPESTARTTADKDKRYKLMADTASVDLKAHVGHQVQITGVVVDGSATRTPGPGAEPSPTPSSPSASKESSDAKTLRVKSVKMIASSCTGT